MEVEKKKLELLQIKLSQISERQEQHCEDMLFDTYMKELTPMQKLRTRNKITEVIMDEMNSVTPRLTMVTILTNITHQIMEIKL